MRCVGIGTENCRVCVRITDNVITDFALCRNRDYLDSLAFSVRLTEDFLYYFVLIKNYDFDNIYNIMSLFCLYSMCHLRQYTFSLNIFNTIFLMKKKKLLLATKMCLTVYILKQTLNWNVMKSFVLKRKNNYFYIYHINASNNNLTSKRRYSREKEI